MEGRSEIRGGFIQHLWVPFGAVPFGTVTDEIEQKSRKGGVVVHSYTPKIGSCNKPTRPCALTEMYSPGTTMFSLAAHNGSGSVTIHRREWGVQSFLLIYTSDRLQ